MGTSKYPRSHGLRNSRSIAGTDTSTVSRSGIDNFSKCPYVPEYLATHQVNHRLTLVTFTGSDRVDRAICDRGRERPYLGTPEKARSTAAQLVSAIETR